MRTFDDRLGISLEELQRKERLPALELPFRQQLLADREYLHPDQIDDVDITQYLDS